MKKLMVFPVLLALCMPAAAEYYTANEDIYFHQSADCRPGSVFSISETAGWEFGKIACPVCVNRTAHVGEIIELPVPADFNLYSADMDAQGNILLAGYAGTPMEMHTYIALCSPEGQLLWKQQGSTEGLFYRDADVLSDGSIAALSPRSADAGSDLWSIQLAKDGSVTHQLPDISNVYRIEPTAGGFLVGSHSDTENYLLQKFDNGGSPLWLTREPGHMYLTLCSKEDMHLGYGRRAVDVSDYQGDQNAFALIWSDDGSILARIEDDSSWEFTCGAWCPDGGVLLGTSAGTIAKYSADGKELWSRNLSHIRGENKEIPVNGEAVRVLAVQDIISAGEGHLLALLTDDDYARMLHVDASGSITRDWIESIGDFAVTDALQMFSRGDSTYLLASGLTIDEMTAYEAGMNHAQIPRKYTFKRIAAAN